MLVDSHCHLDFPELAQDQAGVIERAREAGVSEIITISTRVRRFQEVRKVAEAHEQVYCSIGTHPHHADEELDVTADDLARIAEHPKVVAIGEAGLDFHYDNSPRQAQERGFRTHIEAARLTGLPLIIHARSADEEIGRILEEETARAPFSAVLHCYTGGRELARRGVALGFYVSFSGILTFRKSEELRALATELPLERLLVETDAPYLAPTPHRGKTNEPAYVVETAKALAAARGLGLEETSGITTRNVHRLFHKMSTSLPQDDPARDGRVSG